MGELIRGAAPTRVPDEYTCAYIDLGTVIQVPFPPDTAASPGAAINNARVLHAAHILAKADALEARARRTARREVRTVLAATSKDFVFLRLAPRVVIGRARDCNLVLDCPRVSRHHAALFVHFGELWIEDLDSTNGTTICGEQVKLRALAPGEEVRFGGEHVRFWLR